MLAFRSVTLVAALVCGLTAYASAPATLTPGYAAKLSALLPATAQNTQVMKLESKLTIVNLQRLVLQKGGSPDALRVVMASAAKGEQPSYDSRLGISREEFGKYITFQPVFTSTGRTLKLAVVRDSGRVTFTDASGNGLLRGVSIDLQSGELRVPEGFTFKPVVISVSNAPDRSIDIRSGFQWNLKGFNAETESGIHGQFSVYQLGDGQSVLSYTRRSSLIRGVFNNTESEIILKYAR